MSRLCFSVFAILCIAQLIHYTYGFSLSATSKVPSVLPQRRRGCALSFDSQKLSCWMSIPSSALLDQSDLRGDEEPQISLRSSLRALTGFSLTAVREAARAATGISLTFIYASTLAATGVWIRQTMKLILAPFPAWFRYFVQPFLVLYYAPLFILRNLTGPTRKRARSVHKHAIESWKDAVVAAADRTASIKWPLLDDGSLKEGFSDVDIRDAVAESIETAMEVSST
jgi:hypothetical protein